MNMCVFTHQHRQKYQAIYRRGNGRFLWIVTWWVIDPEAVWVWTPTLSLAISCKLWTSPVTESHCLPGQSGNGHMLISESHEDWTSVFKPGKPVSCWLYPNPVFCLTSPSPHPFSRSTSPFPVFHVLVDFSFLRHSNLVPEPEGVALLG